MLGLSVPNDLSITGFDDIGLAELVDPPLTPVRVPHRAMGQAAADRILSLVTGKTADSLKLESQLFPRFSMDTPHRP